MARVIIASSADADYAEIIADLAAKAGWRMAAKYDELFKRLYDRLADHPGSGAPRPALGQNIRIGNVSPYIVIYRNDDVSNTVTVLRIVHSRRRISGRMLGSA
jgi:toxin ParE1/3/4